MVRVLQHITENWQSLLEISKPIHKEYCELHDYSYHLKVIEPYPVYNGIEKLNQILRECDKGDIALVLDGDAIITNLTIKVEDFLEDGKDFYVSDGINMGVFIVGLTAETEWMIEKMISAISMKIFQCEQDAFEGLVDSKCVKVCSHPCFNSYLSELYPEVPQPVSEEQGQWVEGSFILHVPAQSLETRIEVFKSTKITR